MKTKKQSKNRILSIVLSLVMVLGLLPMSMQMSSAADAMSYVEYSWDETNNTAVSETKSVTEYTAITDDLTTWNTGWYVATGEVTISSRVNVIGDVHLILMDDAQLTASKGIWVASGNALTIYGQIESSGKLIIPDVDMDQAGIGSNEGESAGIITIHGGNISAVSDEFGSAAIGGGNNAPDATVIIYHGEVFAKSDTSDGAAIGAGRHGKANVTIYGGNITATAVNNGPAIGGNDGFIVTIRGGTIIANGGSGAAGIGGEYCCSDGTVVITGGNIKAIAGEKVNYYHVQRYPQAIGNAALFKASSTTVSVTDGNGNNVSLNTITLNGASDSTPVTAINGVSYGLSDVTTTDTDKLYFYLPSGTEVASITAGDVEYICKDSSLTYYTNHIYADASCVSTQACIRCRHTVGEKLDHNFVNGVCSGCGMDETDGAFYISTADQLMTFAAYVNLGNYGVDASLMDDIDLSGYDWIPIAQTAMGEGVTDGYTGTFDGNGHVISNVSFNDSVLHLTSGIFGTVHSGGIVKNLGVESFTFERGNSPDRRAGGIAGQLMSGGTIVDCYVINSTINVTGRVVGGIVGLNKGTVENCFTAGLTLDAYSQRFGGITGDYAGGSIVNCYTDYSVIGSTASSVGTATDSEAGVSTERFASGEITYKLNGSDSDGVWKQTLTVDAYPKFTGSEVYYYSSGYTNHVHSFEYTASGDTITAFCTVDSCDNTDGGSIKIVAPVNSVFDGAAKTAEVENNLVDKEKAYTVTYSTPDGSAPVNVGTYIATLSLDDGTATASIEFTIAECPHKNYTDDICDNCGAQKADYSKYFDALDRYYALTDEYADILVEKTGDYIKGKVQEIVDEYLGDEEISGNFSVEKQYIVDGIADGVNEICDTIEKGIADGTLIIADYTEIDEAIKAIDEALENATISDEMANELSDIKADLEALKADANTSVADLANSGLLARAEAIAKTMNNCVDGNHTDADGDYLCDNGCGHEFEKPAEPDTPDVPTDGNCDHLCHKDGILGFIWKIISFLQRFFGIQQYCDCGVLHYEKAIFG